MKRLLVALLAMGAVAAACGGGDSTADPASEAAGEVSDSDAVSPPGIRLVSAADGAQIQSNPPQDLVILDVRTPDEFAAGHLEGAIMIDFYRDDFAEQLAELDPDVPYLLYCRSGNRSGQTTAIMDRLGFSNVADIDGGIVSWADAGLPVVAG